MAVTFVHTGDLHLGSPLQAIAGADEAMAERLARATEVAFERTVEVALEREVDFVVVAGDCYDREARSIQATEVLVDGFQRLDDAGIPSYVVHGNHDPLGAGPTALDFPDSVHVFGSDDVGTAYFPNEADPAAAVLGQSYGARHESNRLYYSYTPEDRSIPAIGLLHTGLNPEGNKYAPCSAADLADKPIDYWALGHIHNPRELDGAPGAYCGIPQPRHAGEPAVGGCLVVDLPDRGDPDIEFVPTSPIVWQDHRFDVADADADLHNLNDVETALEEAALGLRERDPGALIDHELPLNTGDWSPEGFICRWTLAGRGEIHAVVGAESEEATATLTERLRDRLGDGDPFCWTETVRDRTRPPLPDRETLIAEDELVGELVDLAADLKEDTEQREALRAEAGDLWQWIEDPDVEGTPADRLPLHDERLDALFDDALTLAVDELAKRRYADVD